MLYANIDGQKCLPEKGLRGICPSCGEPVIAKCGSQVTHHWAHKAGSECDTWSEAIGPWHLEWQGLVRPEFVEMVMDPHRADIVGSGDIVIELQHSPLPPDQIAAREAFYGNMVWLFDATERFEMIPIGCRTFFSFRRTKHVNACSKPVFLDFGAVLVEVEAFTKALAKLHGFGRTRTRQWFAERYLADRLRDGASPARSRPEESVRWYRHRRYHAMPYPTRWADPNTGAPLTVPKGSLCIPLNWYEPSAPRIYEWERLIDQHPNVANGWSKQELAVIQRFLGGRPTIVDGLLRLVPGPAKDLRAQMTVSAASDRLARVEGHIAAGRIPELKQTTKQTLLERAREYEIRQYGKPVDQHQSGTQSPDDQQRLF